MCYEKLFHLCLQSKHYTENEGYWASLIRLCTNTEKPSTSLFHSLLAESTKKRIRCRKHTLSTWCKSLNQNVFNKLLCLAFIPVSCEALHSQCHCCLLSWQHQWQLLGCLSVFTLHTVKQASNSMLCQAECRELPGILLECCNPSRTISSDQDSSSTTSHFIHSFSVVMWK